MKQHSLAELKVNKRNLVSQSRSLRGESLHLRRQPQSLAKYGHVIATDAIAVLAAIEPNAPTSPHRRQKKHFRLPATLL